ncbi:hypothetical protein Tsubulata_011301 [Turnera subulata]|uniref:Uncharacterized protein n=1 Tax=Turnera subulata TaxID=218843 RepID=A0A9Q0FF76_9ROSI|nr:hypothetical protein Tsubulata_011301 [Turnera subulata]
MLMRAFGVIVGGNGKLGRAGLRVMDKSRRNRRFYEVGFAENGLYDGLNSGQKGVDLDLYRKGVDLRKESDLKPIEGHCLMHDFQYEGRVNGDSSSSTSATNEDEGIAPADDDNESK